MDKNVIILSNIDVGIIDISGQVHVLENLHNERITQAITSQIQNQNFLVTGGNDKLIKVWEIKNNSQNHSLWQQYHIAKKVKRMVSSKNQILISDKHGDIYALKYSDIILGPFENIQNLNPIQSNLAIPKYLQFFKIYDKEIIILSDDYSKIKVINANNTDEILNILIPFEGFLKQIIPLGENFICLFKIKDDDNDNTHFTVKQISQKQFLDDNYQFINLFPSNEIEKSIAKSDKIRLILSENQLHYLVQNEGSINIFKDKFFDKPINKLKYLLIQSVTQLNNNFIICAKKQIEHTYESILNESLILNYDKPLEIKQSIIFKIK